jgi:hypothetical protein
MRLAALRLFMSGSIGGTIVTILAIVASTGAATAQPDTTGTFSCRLAGPLGTLRDLPEASGLAISRRHAGMLWAHNDSGQPLIFAVADDGSVKGRVRIEGARVYDWEDVAVGPCAQGSCLYIADIGDNHARRDRITIYRVPEPAPGDATSQPAEAFHGAFPDGPRDAESLFVTSENDLFVITKGERTSVSLYRFPRLPRPNATAKLQWIATFDTADKSLARERVTAAAASPDGRWVVVRTHRSVVFYRTADLVAGNVRDALRFDVSALKEPQGEGVALDADGTVYLAGEAGGGSGTFARLSCTLPQ